MKISFTFISFLFCLNLSAQIIDPKQPEMEVLEKESTIPLYIFPEVDHKALLAEDEEEMLNKEAGLRFAISFEKKLDLKKDALFFIDKKGRQNWILKLRLPGAYGAGIILDRFHIPEEAELFVFNQDKSSVNGAITAVNNNEYNALQISPVQGEEIYILYIEAFDSQFQGEVQIKSVTHLYRDLFHSEKGFGDSGSCNINVVCEEGDPWQDQVRSVALVINENGTRHCTGALINNTALDGTPYLLTADHCLPSDLSDVGVWSFIFNYKSSSCSPTVNGLLGNSVFGSELIASNTINDFALLELSSDPPTSYNVYFSGWSRSTLLISSTTGIHHPSGDVMKISFDDDPPVLSGYLGGSGTDYWKVVDWDLGTTEGGSSGSPLYNPSGKIIGQLRGGQAACTNDLPDYYGAFYKSWDNSTQSSERLKDWLDPTGSDVSSLNGINLNEVGIEEVHTLAFNLYPNPVSEAVNLQFDNAIFIEEILIMDLSGRQLKNIPLQQYLSYYSLDLKDLSNGAYLLKVNNSEGSFSKVFIIE